MIPLILKHVEPDTTILTGIWKLYFGLTSNGMHHFTVNNSTNFVDPITSANSQTFESSWRAVKGSLTTGIKSDDIANHLAEYLYQQDIRLSNEDPFQDFLQAVKYLYTV